jgi:hypothetical protein
MGPVHTLDKTPCVLHNVFTKSRGGLDIALIRELNPWWIDPSMVDDDFHIKDASSALLIGYLKLLMRFV